MLRFYVQTDQKYDVGEAMAVSTFGPFETIEQGVNWAMSHLENPYETNPHPESGNVFRLGLIVTETVDNPNCPGGHAKFKVTTATETLEVIVDPTKMTDEEQIAAVRKYQAKIDGKTKERQVNNATGVIQELVRVIAEADMDFACQQLKENGWKMPAADFDAWMKECRDRAIQMNNEQKAKGNEDPTFLEYTEKTIKRMREAYEASVPPKQHLN